MTEDRPQYQAANKSFGDPTPTPIELAKKLRYLSNDMMVLSAEMQYVGGFGQMANISAAMELSARNLRAWAHEIEEAQG